MKRNWQKLTYPEQKVFLDRAEYLIERGYVINKTVTQLAKRIYEQDS